HPELGIVGEVAGMGGSVDLEPIAVVRASRVSGGRHRDALVEGCDRIAETIDAERELAEEPATGQPVVENHRVALIGGRAYRCRRAGPESGPEGVSGRGGSVELGRGLLVPD